MIDKFPFILNCDLNCRGMIDSPGGNEIMDRGYDFPGVIRWFASRADVILVFFDPDKPGTTGETMSVLVSSLSGMDHKLLIVLNKADQFEKIHDFARAYGSLCWNLSKVIPRKDLPPIFTMSLTEASDGSNSKPLASSLSDLAANKDDVVEQVMQAPKRRIDNVVTNLYDSTFILSLYSRVWNDIVHRYRKEWRYCKLREIGMASGTGVAVGSAQYFGLDFSFLGGISGASVIAVGGLAWFQKSYMASFQEKLVSLDYLSSSFQRTHQRQIQDADEYVASVYQQVRDPLRSALNTAFVDGGSLNTASASELQKLDDILEIELPRLRRLANETEILLMKS